MKRLAGSIFGADVGWYHFRKDIKTSLADANELKPPICDSPSQGRAHIEIRSRVSLAASPASQVVSHASRRSSIAAISLRKQEKATLKDSLMSQTPFQKTRRKSQNRVGVFFLLSFVFSFISAKKRVIFPRLFFSSYFPSFLIENVISPLLRKNKTKTNFL